MRFSKLILSFAAVIVMMTACEKTHNNNPGGGNGYARPAINLEGLTVDGKFPIIAWTDESTNDYAKRFTSMRECGINVYLGWYNSLDKVMAALDGAETAGIKLITKSDELFSDTENTVKAMMSHPALFGYHIKDEPEVSEIPTLATITKRISSIDDNHFCYINLYPNWAWGNIDDYMSKLTSFLSQVPVRFLSFDHYPVMEVDGVSSLRKEWYKNLEDIRRVARARNIQFWAFALSLSHKLDNVLYPIPTIAELRVQMFSNLVYGAQGFQYFTYWGIYQNGPTQVYERVKTVNNELQSLSKIFLGADVTDVWHTGSTIPYGTKELKAMPDGISSLSTSPNGAVISKVVKDGNTYIAIVNKDYKANMALDIVFSAKAWRIDKEGYKTEAKSGSYEVGPGDIMLFLI